MQKRKKIIKLWEITDRYYTPNDFCVFYCEYRTDKKQSYKKTLAQFCAKGKKYRITIRNNKTTN